MRRAGKISPAWFLIRPDPELSLTTDEGGDDHFGVFKLLDGGCVMRLTISLRRHPMITLSASLKDHSWFESWTYPREESAAVDFAVWEPGGTLICYECKCTRGGDDPPGKLGSSPSQSEVAHSNLRRRRTADCPRLFRVRTPMITFKLSHHSIRQCEVVEIFDDGTLVGVLYPEPFGVRLMSKYLSADKGKITYEPLNMSINVRLP